MINSVLNIFIRNSVWYRDGIWRGALKFKSLKKTSNLKFANTGSNSGRCAFDYKAAGVNGFNFALGPQDLPVDCQLLMAHEGRLASGAVVFIPICPFSGLTYTHDQTFWFRYYPILPIESIPNADAETAQLALNLWNNPSVADPRRCWKECWWALRGKLRKLIKRPRSVGVKLDDSAHSYVNGWMKQFSIGDLEEPLTEEFKKQYHFQGRVLREMINFCNARGWRPILVMPPIHGSLGGLLTATFRDSYIGTLLREISDLNVPFWDYSDWSELRDDSYYANALLLNKRGAAVFTREVVRRAGL